MDKAQAEADRRQTELRAAMEAAQREAEERSVQLLADAEKQREELLASVFVLLSVVLGFSVFRVMTGSMAPEIPEDSLLVVKKRRRRTLSPGM